MTTEVSKDTSVVDLRWLAKGEKDPHPTYVGQPREQLMGANISDDELAYNVSMLSTISDDRDMQMLLESHRTGGDYINKNGICEIAKDRIRWLSRRVAILEGRYPGMVPAPLGKVDVDDQFQQSVAEARLERQVPLIIALCGITETTGIHNLEEVLTANKIDIDPIKIGAICGMFMNGKPVQRWQIYLGVVKELLKKGIYVPYWDDVYQVVSPGKVEISKSKYHTTPKTYQVNKLVTLS